MTVIVNPFDAGGFTLAEMSAAIQMLPNPYGRWPAGAARSDFSATSPSIYRGWSAHAGCCARCACDGHHRRFGTLVCRTPHPAQRRGAAEKSRGLGAWARPLVKTR